MGEIGNLNSLPLSGRILGGERGEAIGYALGGAGMGEGSGRYGHGCETRWIF